MVNEWACRSAIDSMVLQIMVYTGMGHHNHKYNDNKPCL